MLESFGLAQLTVPEALPVECVTLTPLTPPDPSENTPWHRVIGSGLVVVVVLVGGIVVVVVVVAVFVFVDVISTVLELVIVAGSVLVLTVVAGMVVVTDCVTTTVCGTCGCAVS